MVPIEKNFHFFCFCFIDFCPVFDYLLLEALKVQPLKLSLRVQKKDTMISKRNSNLRVKNSTYNTFFPLVSLYYSLFLVCYSNSSVLSVIS